MTAAGAATRDKTAIVRVETYDKPLAYQYLIGDRESGCRPLDPGKIVVEQPLRLIADAGRILPEITGIENTAGKLLKFLVLDCHQEPLADFGGFDNLVE
jgi:hypothetical protein